MKSFTLDIISSRDAPFCRIKKGFFGAILLSLYRGMTNGSDRSEGSDGVLLY